MLNNTIVDSNYQTKLNIFWQGTKNDNQLDEENQIPSENINFKSPLPYQTFLGGPLLITESNELTSNENIISNLVEPKNFLDKMREETNFISISQSYITNDNNFKEVFKTGFVLASTLEIEYTSFVSLFIKIYITKKMNDLGLNNINLIGLIVEIGILN